MYESVVSGMMEGRGVGAGLGGCRGGPFIPALGPGGRLPPIGLWGVVRSVGWIGLIWAGSLLIGLAWGPPWEGLWESRRGTP